MSEQKKGTVSYITLSDHNKKMESANSRQKSKYNEQYFKFFDNLTPEKLLEPMENTDLIKMLKDRGIQTKFDRYSAFNIRILSFSPNYEVLEIQLQWGYYKLKANVLNILGESVFHSHEFSKGANAKVYHIQEQSCRFSIKCIRNKNQQQQFTGTEKIRALKEYFLNRVTSALERGPFLSKSCGFDILFTEHCIQFTLQTCRSIEVFRNETILSLKNSLQVLHRMRIVHFDIKPQNVMWSDYFKREVYIDFGLSQVFDGEPGFRYSIHFKGSPNFCTPEMSALLFSEQIGFADIYYNDVFGLLETIKNSKFVSQFFEDSQYCNKSNVFKKAGGFDQIQNDIDPRKNKLTYFDNSQNHFRKIIQLKYYVYTKNNDLIQTMYQQSEQKKLIFSNQILSFIKNNCEAFYLQQFYQDYIDDSLKKSVQFGWIDQWANSVYPKQGIMPQKQSQHYSFYNCLKILSNKDRNDIDSLNRAEIEEFLLIDKVIDAQIYFYCFLRYTSFINNVYGVNIKQKQKYLQYFLKVMKVNIDSDKIKEQSSIDQEVIVYMYLKQVYKFIFDYYINNKFSSNKTPINNSKRIKLILSILQHIFFFSLLQTSQALQYLNKIYGLDSWSDIDRLHILLAIQSHNDWNLVSLFSTKNVSFQIIESWFRDKTQEFSSQKLYSVCRYVLDHSKNRQTSYENLLLDEEQIDNMDSFKIILWKNQFLSQLNSGNQYSLIKIRRMISKEIPYSHNRGLFSIYIHLLIIFDICYENIEEYEYICQIFKRNIRSEHFYNSLFFVKLSQITKINDLSLKMKLLTHLVKIINLSNSWLTMVILCRQLDRLQKIIRNKPLSALLSFVEFTQFIQQLQKACLRIDFRLLQQKQFIHKINIISFKDYIYCYFSLKNQIDVILRRPPLSFSCDLVALNTLIENNSCQQSRTHLTFQFIRLKLQEIMILNPQTAVQMLFNQFQGYLSFYKNSKHTDEVYFHFKIYSSIISKLSILQCKDIRLLQIVYQFYQFVKTKKMLEKYLENRQITNIISLTLMAILQFYNLNELVYFIRESLKYIHYTQNYQTLRSVISEYKRFFKNAPQIFIKYGIYEMFASLRVTEEKLPYTAAIYYSFVQFSRQTSEKYYYLYKICLMMQLMASKMISYFHVQLLLLIISGAIVLAQHYFIFSNYLGKRTIEQRIQRKTRMLKHKVIKLLCAHYQNHRNIQVAQVKIRKNKNQNKKRLINKCCKIKAFKVNNLNTQILLIQPRLW